MPQLSILIVDDDHEVSSLMRLKLSREAPHFSIKTVDDGRECIDFLKSNPVDCILSDYQMPVMDGMRLLKALNDQGNTVPFIFVTGQGSEEIAREAFKNGAYDYFTKDVGFAHFARIINSVEQAVRHRMAEDLKAHVEDRLLRSEARNKAIIAALPDLVFMFDRDGRFVEIQAGNDKDLFVPKDKAIGRVILDLLPGDVAESALVFIRKALDTRKVQVFEYRLPMPSGPRDYEARLVASGKDEVLAVVRDITDRHKAG